MKQLDKSNRQIVFEIKLSWDEITRQVVPAETGRDELWDEGIVECP
jgi:hypothetical protein